MPMQLINMWSSCKLEENIFLSFNLGERFQRNELRLTWQNGFMGNGYV